MNFKLDYRASAAKCRDMAEKATARERNYWLHMEQFWLDKVRDAELPTENPMTAHS